MLATILTDYLLNEIWIYNEVDIYFVSTEEMKSELASLSNSSQEIFATCIPIDLKFGSLQKKSPQEKFTVLIMGGGLGLGSIEETLQELEKISGQVKNNHRL